jgi:hypothetical protein
MKNINFRIFFTKIKNTPLWLFEQALKNYGELFVNFLRFMTTAQINRAGEVLKTLASFFAMSLLIARCPVS